jgi:hypothetical protein
VAGDEDARLGEIPVGQGDAGVGADARRGGDAGDDLEGHPGLDQLFHLLAAPPENEGVAALQAHHLAAFTGQPHQQGVDALLGQGMVGGLLAHVDTFGGFGQTGQNLLADQVVVNQHIRLQQQARGAQGEQLRVAGAGAHQVDPARPGRGTFAGEGGIGHVSAPARNVSG